MYTSGDKKKSFREIYNRKIQEQENLTKVGIGRNWKFLKLFVFDKISLTQFKNCNLENCNKNGLGSTAVFEIPRYIL